MQMGFYFTSKSISMCGSISQRNLFQDYLRLQNKEQWFVSTWTPKSVVKFTCIHGTSHQYVQFPLVGDPRTSCEWVRTLFLIRSGTSLPELNHPFIISSGDPLVCVLVMIRVELSRSWPIEPQWCRTRRKVREADEKFGKSARILWACWECFKRLNVPDFAR